MVDNQVPTNQFHPYQPSTAVPHRDEPGTKGMFGKGGITGDSLRNAINNVNVKQTVDQARGYVRANPGKVLGGLAAAIIGLGLLSNRNKMTNWKTRSR